MSSFNPNLTYFLERLQGFSTNIFRLESQARTTASPNQIITFDLPSNSIVNLRSFKVFCNCQLTDRFSYSPGTSPLNNNQFLFPAEGHTYPL